MFRPIRSESDQGKTVIEGEMVVLALLTEPENRSSSVNVPVSPEAVSLIVTCSLAPWERRPSQARRTLTGRAERPIVPGERDSAHATGTGKSERRAGSAGRTLVGS